MRPDLDHQRTADGLLIAVHPLFNRCGGADLPDAQDPLAAGEGAIAAEVSTLSVIES